MAYAVTHVLIAIVIFDLLRHYLFGRKRFPRYLVVIGGIAGLAPDIDIPLGWVVSAFSRTSANFHGTFTHTIFFVLLFLAIAVIRQYQRDMKWARIFYVVSAGWFIHLVLDCLFVGYKTLLWPFQLGTAFCPYWATTIYMAGIDGVILVFWLAHEEIHRKIKDFI